MQKSFLFVLIILFTAACVGASSAILVTRSLEQYAQSLLSDQQFSAIASRISRSVSETQSDVRKEVQETAQHTLAYVVNDENVLYATGVVLSADGWLLVPQEPFSSFLKKDATLGAFTVWYNGASYRIETVQENALYPVLALRAAEAQGFTVTDAAFAGEVLLGESLYAMPRAQEMHTLTFAGEVPLTLPTPLETARPVYVSGEALSVFAPLFSEDARWFGFITPGRDVLSAQEVWPFVKQVIRGEDVAHAALGAWGSEHFTGEGGVRIVAPKGERTGIVKGGSADIFGLLDDDVIIALDDIYITPTMSFADILAQYAPGQEVTLRVKRGGEVREMPVVLGTREELVY